MFKLVEMENRKNRLILAVILGIVSQWVVNGLITWIGFQFTPMVGGMQDFDSDHVNKTILVIARISGFIASFVGVMVALKIHRPKPLLTTSLVFGLPLSVGLIVALTRNFDDTLMGAMPLQLLISGMGAFAAFLIFKQPQDEFEGDWYVEGADGYVAEDAGSTSTSPRERREQEKSGWRGILSGLVFIVVLGRFLFRMAEHVDSVSVPLIVAIVVAVVSVVYFVSKD